MTAEELMTFANINKGTDMSSYEHFAIAEKSARRPSGVGIAGLAIGSTALLIGIGAWVFGGVYAAQGARANCRDIDRLATFQLQDRVERVNTTPNQLDIIRIMNNAQSGAGAGAGAGANAVAQAEALLLAAGMGNNRSGQVCPQPVALYQPAMPCACPGSCNG